MLKLIFHIWIFKVEDGLEGSRQWQVEYKSVNEKNAEKLATCRAFASKLGSQQVFVKTLKGQTITIDINPSDTLDKFKAQVFANPLVDAQIENLAYKDINQTLERYVAILQSGAEPDSDSENESENESENDAENENEVESVKANIKADIRFIFNGKDLMDGTLSDYNITKEDTVHMIGRTRGGGI